MAVEITYTPPAVNAAVLLAAAVPVVSKLGAEHLLAQSLPLVPRDTDALYNSGHVSMDGNDAVVGFHAVNEKDSYDYGIRQHEDHELHHPNGGQANFLGQPMETEARAVLGILAAGLAERLM